MYIILCLAFIIGGVFSNNDTIRMFGCFGVASIFSIADALTDISRSLIKKNINEEINKGSRE